MARGSDEQRRIKLGRISEAFAVLELVLPPVDWVAGPDRDYRNRVRLRIDGGRIEFFNAEKSLDCVVLEPGLREAIVELRAAALVASAALEHFAWVEVRGSDGSGRVLACLAPRLARSPDAEEPDALSRARDLLAARLGAHFLVGVLGEPHPPMQRFASVGVDVVVAAGAFLQVNHLVNRALVNHVLTCAAQSGASEFLDLYAGSGNFALPLAARGLAGVAVESSAVSVASLREGAQRAQLGRLEVVHDDVVAALGRQSRQRDFVVADPPRAGLKAAVSQLTRLCSKELLLVSCNPRSLARDVAELSPQFRLQSLSAFDMFPHTEHVELAAQLERTPGRS